MQAPLYVGQKDLIDFNSYVARVVHSAFELGTNRHLQCVKYDAIQGQIQDTYRLVDSSGFATRARNLRRIDIDVFPIPLDRSEVFLIGVSFDWARSGRKFRFNGSQFIIFSGRRKVGSRLLEIEGEAKQLLRLEWEGRLDTGAFESLVHAHPHWQIDALPEHPSATAFEGKRGTVDLADLAKREETQEKTWLSRLHLPCAAVGWMKGPGWSGDQNDCSAHANSPADIEELKAWVGSAARYLNHQLQKSLA